MKGRIVFIVVCLVVLLAAVLVFTLGKRSDHPPADIPPLSYQSINSGIESGFAQAQLENYSRRMKGTWVRWQGEVMDIDTRGTVFVSVDRAPSANVELRLTGKPTAPLNRQQTIRFAGAIKRVRQVETFPPMPNLYVILENGSIE